MLTLVTALFLLTLLTSRLSAQEETWPDPPGKTSDTTQTDQSTPATPRWNWSFSLSNRTGFKLNSPSVLQMSRSVLNAKAVIKLHGSWRLTGEVRAHYDPVKRLGYPDNVWVDPRQILLDGKIRKADVRIGLQQVVWGEADGLRVLDVINPLDYREFILEDFLESRRPLWAARVDVPAGGGSLQAVYVPYFVSGRLPAGTDEFGLGDPFGAGLLRRIGGLPPEIGVRSEPTERPGYRASSSQVGVRYRRSFADWDLSANYFYGWEDIPTSYFNGIEFSQPGVPTVVLKPRFDRKEVFGLTGTTNYGPVVVRLEAGYNRKKALPTRSPGLSAGGYTGRGQFSGVIGADYSPYSWLWMSAQYFLQVSSAPQQSLLLPRPSSLASFYVRTNFFGERFRPELFILTGLNQRQFMIRPRIVRSLGEHLTVGVGGDFLGGSETTTFGYFNSRDRAVIELKWMW